MNKILIRLDASQQIGLGHLMRCLALANEAQRQGWTVCFALRDPPKSVVELISSSNHQIKRFSSISSHSTFNSISITHTDLLLASQHQDALDTLDACSAFKPDWIIIDHYSLDATWMSKIRPFGAKILVIDDLANRDLICDLLLDQNLDATPAKYTGKLFEATNLMLGPRYALLRDEFFNLRNKSLTARLNRKLNNVLITMGGADERNYTLQALSELSRSKYAAQCTFTIIIGSSYAHREMLDDFLAKSKLKSAVFSNVNNMAEFMANADLCIGAAGSSSWERCCLGLPSITLAIADNQKGVVDALQRSKCTIKSNISQIRSDFETFFIDGAGEKLNQMTVKSSLICDGLGVHRVLKKMKVFNEFIKL